MQRKSSLQTNTVLQVTSTSKLKRGWGLSFISISTHSCMGMNYMECGMNTDHLLWINGRGMQFFSSFFHCLAELFRDCFIRANEIGSAAQSFGTSSLSAPAPSLLHSKASLFFLQKALPSYDCIISPTIDALFTKSFLLKRN